MSSHFVDCHCVASLSLSSTVAPSQLFPLKYLALKTLVSSLFLGTHPLPQSLTGTQLVSLIPKDHSLFSQSLELIISLSAFLELSSKHTQLSDISRNASSLLLSSRLTPGLSTIYFLKFVLTFDFSV